MTTIRSLVVFDQLKVHRLVVESKRVKATYTLTKSDGVEVENTMIYTYDQGYFDPRNPEDLNLASMMVAQVALNYGLFFKSIVFDGLFDVHDQQFLTSMIENTSREILVHKFMHKNEFIKAPYNALHIVKMDRYTAAELSFVNTKYIEAKLEKKQSTPDRNQYAILSSGGKDSLLTYGLINEIGIAHPVFINESGRHWFTAVNSYKHFQKTEPNTVKPWCNSDRIFNWMAKQMPFVKENFQQISADIYPIRLWTVAVFLFGVLPVARKRNLGNILIGNEYDTTIKGNEQGISHYHGLYDQSKYFDNALTRYYQKKGWNIYQYSILRSLSELLILKILVKRYPDLQQHQVSCHAAHPENERMLPCGNCEKCRRIVGMLKALDEDPKRCGYTEVQIEKGLNALADRGVKQLGSDAAHLYSLLLEKQLVEKSQHSVGLAKKHPEIEGLRFDRERSTLEDLPIYIRKPLFELLHEYAPKSFKSINKHWLPFNLLQDDEIPYFLNKKDEHLR